MNYKYLFGPVPSRRLGISLGVDLVPFKTCTFNCVYCECGKTTDLTTRRKEYVPTKQVIAELGDYLDTRPQLDFVTLSGSGEPTLHSRMGEVVHFLKEAYPDYRICLLTNGSLFSAEDMRREVMSVDLIIPSLDAVSDAAFRKINRPWPTLDPREIIDGLISLRREYTGAIWLELFIVPSVNDEKPEIVLLKEAIQKIRPDKVQLNALDRPGTEDWVRPASRKELEIIASYLAEESVEIIAGFTPKKKMAAFDKDIANAILSTIKRRPCTAQDLSAVLGLHVNELNKYIHTLLEQNSIETDKSKRGLFFRACAKTNESSRISVKTI